LKHRVHDEDGKIISSYKDPSGYVFFKDGKLFRRVNECYIDIYRQARDSGLFQELIQKKLLIEHEEIEEYAGDDPHLVIRPRMLKFISYPYEWSFSQLKDAALVILEIQRISISYGFTLKDAHAFNIQFDDNLPVMIDTLSFDRWDQTPWEAYRQFCESFLIPLALMRYRNLYLNTLLKQFLNGIPLEIGSKLLPLRTRLSIPLLMHIHLHADRVVAKQKTGVVSSELKPVQKFSEQSMLGLCMSLNRAVRTLELSKANSIWYTYYHKSCIYSPNAFDIKKQFVAEIIEKQRPSVIWDLGCNIGEFSFLAAKYSDLVVAIDSDPMCIEGLYQQCKIKKIANVLPLQMDLINPSPPLGWELQERLSLFERGGCDLVLALALIHHLCISANVPLEYVARLLGSLSKQLVIEFVPKEDPQVQVLLSSRKDVFKNYCREAFESAFAEHFGIIRAERLPESDRILYHMVRLV